MQDRTFCKVIDHITNMGTYINKGNRSFADFRNESYVDKSELIGYINKTLNTQRRYSCVTRCRRFGKSMAAKMLCAYYDKSCDSRQLFDDLAIANKPSFEEHLNKYTVLYLDVTSFTSRTELGQNVVTAIQEKMSKDVKEAYPNVSFDDDCDLMDILTIIYEKTGDRFFFIIDEWDAICREYPERRKYKASSPDITLTVMDQYVMLLRRLFKTQASDDVFVGAYLTGIIPMMKFNTESALNNFREYSMVDPGKLAPFFGFTESEVEELSVQNGVSMEQLKLWYDGYVIGDEPSVYNPYSVMEAIEKGKCKSYWKNTGSYDSVKTYIQMNFDGLKDDVVKMLAGESVAVDTSSFLNDMQIVNCKDDILTVLIHLGYLAYDVDAETCRIPNREVYMEMSNAVEETGWKELAETVQNSRSLLAATIAGNEMAVAKAIDVAHDENTSILSYNDENSLSCVLAIAYIWAKNEYVVHREYATGNGFADLVLIPRRNVNKPAMIIELKYNCTAETAISQIKQKNYPSKIADYTGNILLIGINYNKESKKHTCKIEHFVK